MPVQFKTKRKRRKTQNLIFESEKNKEYHFHDFILFILFILGDFFHFYKKKREKKKIIKNQC